MIKIKPFTPPKKKLPIFNSNQLFLLKSNLFQRNNFIIRLQIQLILSEIHFTKYLYYLYIKLNYFSNN